MSYITYKNEDSDIKLLPLLTNFIYIQQSYFVIIYKITVATRPSRLAPKLPPPPPKPRLTQQTQRHRPNKSSVHPYWSVTRIKRGNLETILFSSRFKSLFFYIKKSVAQTFACLISGFENMFIIEQVKKFKNSNSGIK